MMKPAAREGESPEITGTVEVGKDQEEYVVRQVRKSMNHASLSVTLAVLLFLAYRFVIYPAFLSPLSRIPAAHWSAPFSRLWILWIRFTHRENRTLHSAHHRLGPVVRVGPSELSINDLDSVRTVYQGGFEKPVWYSVFDNYGAPCMFSARRAAEHSARKRLISHVYSKSYIQSSPAASAQSRSIIYDRFLPILEASTAETQAPHGVDVYSVFMAATMDFIAGYIFGLQNGTDFLSDKAYREHFLELYKARNDYGYYDQELPQLTKICRKLGIPLCPKWADEANKELGEWCQRLCEKMQRFLDSEEQLDRNSLDQPIVWNALVGGLQTEKAKNGRGSVLYPTALSNFKLSVASELFDHVLAGQETAGLTLTYLCWRLSQSLDLQEQLRAELLSLSPNMRLAEDGASAMPDAKQLDSLPLLHAVLTETLRLHAPIPGPQPRQTPESGCRIGPYAVPGGVRVAALAHTLHQMKLMIAAIYSNYTSHIVDDEGMENQSDGYTGRPENERLFLRFQKAV
ncbi:hypothetical protein NEMBOFW57_008891 [Staphylotrichum longicolle]|uniref:Uncharacterized protein n=1 Tax=Staphylotrichum longicolle TaxID=669026 RepID=A0AAD4ESV4_9PEZI|nr:hypothetical protein NEMBOFW57_008891 [Staphylotrichum longicolle]